MSAAAKERVALIRARLAEEEKEALEAIKADICQWLGKQDVLSLDVTPASFLPVLESGVQLCKLAGLVQEGARRHQTDGSGPAVRVPLEPLAWKQTKAGRGTAMFQASSRDNAALFIRWCRELGVEEAVIFESVGLVEHTDEKRVILCLLDVARFAERVGIVPPQLVQLEREIDLLESDPPPAPASTEEDVSSEEGGSVEASETVLHTEERGEGLGEPSREDKLSGREEGVEEGQREVEEDEGEGEKDEQLSAEEEEPPAKRVKCTPSDEPRDESPGKPLSPQHPPSPNSQPSHNRRSTPHKRRSSSHSQYLSGSKKNAVDKKVRVLQNSSVV